MSLRRYSRAPIIAGGTQYGTPRGAILLNQAVSNGSIPATLMVIKERERLDIIAGKVYNDASLWWIIAAASGIGWMLQVPPGTRLMIPNNLSDVESVVG